MDPVESLTASKIADSSATGASTNPKEEGTTDLSEESRDAVVVLCVDNEEDRSLENSLKEQGPLERVSSEAPAVKLGDMQELKSKARSKTFKLSSIDRNLESSSQEQGIDISR